MFFPLGLGFRTRTFPIVTWLIILTCCIFYALNHENSYQKTYMKLPQHMEVERAHDHLFFEYCARDFQYKDVCQQFALERGLFLERDDIGPLLLPQSRNGQETVIKFSRFYRNFRKKLDKNVSALSGLPSYPLFLKAEENLSSAIQKIRKRHHLLHADNLNLVSIFFAIFSHDSLPHLLGNMLFLFIFGRYVETRMGHTFYLASYLILGGASLAIYAYMNPMPFLHILGASANVSVVMGAFYGLFFHKRLKIFFFYFFSKVAELPVKTFMFLFFMLQEFIFSLTGEGNVAYLAHAIGLVLGSAAGYGYRKAKPLPKDFLYEEEVQDWEKAKNSPTREEFIRHSAQIIKYNPNNKEVVKALTESLTAPHTNLRDLDLEEELMLRKLIPSYLRDEFDAENYETFFSTLEKIPRSWSMSACLKRFTQKELLLILDKAIDQQKLLESVLLIQAYTERYRGSRKNYNLLKTLKSILDHMELNEATKKQLVKIKNLSSSSALRGAINMRLLEENS